MMSGFVAVSTDGHPFSINRIRELNWSFSAAVQTEASNWPKVAEPLQAVESKGIPCFCNHFITSILSSIAAVSISHEHRFSQPFQHLDCCFGLQWNMSRAPRDTHTLVQQLQGFQAPAVRRCITKVAAFMWDILI